MDAQKHHKTHSKSHLKPQNQENETNGVVGQNSNGNERGFGFLTGLLKTLKKGLFQNTSQRGLIEAVQLGEYPVSFALRRKYVYLHITLSRSLYLYLSLDNLFLSFFIYVTMYVMIMLMYTRFLSQRIAATEARHRDLEKRGIRAMHIVQKLFRTHTHTLTHYTGYQGYWRDEMYI